MSGCSYGSWARTDPVTWSVLRAVMSLDERTTLLRHAAPHPTGGPLPAILPAVSRLKDTIDTQYGLPEPDTSLGEQERTAFLLLVYLHLYRSLLTPIVSVQDIRMVWTSAIASTNKANETEARLLEIWTTYLDTQSPSLSEVQSLLWSEFPLEYNSTRCTKGMLATSMSNELHSIYNLCQWSTACTPNMSHQRFWFIQSSKPP